MFLPKIDPTFQHNQMGALYIKELLSNTIDKTKKKWQKLRQEEENENELPPS